MRHAFTGWILARVLFPLLLVISVAELAHAQTAEDSNNNDVDMAATAPVGLSTTRALAIISQHPEIKTELKQMAAKWLDRTGSGFAGEEVSDETLSRLVTRDAGFRAATMQLLEAQGYSVSGGVLGDDEPGTAEPDDTSDRNDFAVQPEPDARPTAKGNPRSVEPEADDASRDGIGRLAARRDGLGRQSLDRPNLRRDQPAREAVSRPNPYPGVPSLHDLYAQMAPPSVSVKRFGSEVFQRSGNAVKTAMLDRPVGPDYVLGPGDGLNVDLWGGVSQRLVRTVDREGRILLPEAGTTTIAGFTLAKAQQVIEDVLQPQYRNVRVAVSVAHLRTVRVYVVGDVEHPDAYDVSSVSTPVNALYAAGGPTAGGSLRGVEHYRGARLIQTVDLYDLLLKGARAEGERLQPGDTILVRPVGPQATLSGAVRRPAIYELKQEKTLADVVRLAGGLTVSAAVSQITVERIEPHQGRVTLNLHLPATPNGQNDKQDDEQNGEQNIEAAMAAFAVRDGDRLTVSSILPYSNRTVYLQGHVVRPGKYEFHDGMTVADLVRSYHDLLPEPSDHAEIIRLCAPDLRPETIEFSLEKTLRGVDPLALESLDTVRIFGRYEVDAPRVSIYGEVLRPGKYPLSESMTAAALVRMAGGFRRSAFTEMADVSTYAVKSGATVSTEHRQVAIRKALAGEEGADLLLQPGDVVTIRQLPGWDDIGASVEIAGAVGYPGKYGLEEGERLSALLRRAGGFRAGAYPAGAVLERVDIRKLGEKNRAELIQKIEMTGVKLRMAPSTNGQDQLATMQAMDQQQQQIISRLRNQPVTGRLVIKISSDFASWENSAADPQLRNGDVITVPKQPDFVLVAGQVYNSSAIAYSPGRDAAWYLKQAGGATEVANKKNVFVIRANGSVVGKGSGGEWFGGNVLTTRMRPGDTVVVPEKIVGGSPFWKELLNTAQLGSAAAVTAKVVSGF